MISVAGLALGEFVGRARDAQHDDGAAGHLGVIERHLAACVHSRR